MTGIILLLFLGDVAAERRRLAAEAPDEPDGAAVGSVVSTAAAAAPRSYPIPPMDLPHYHGIGVAAGAGDEPRATTGGPSDPGSTANGTSKEVSGV